MSPPLLHCRDVFCQRSLWRQNTSTVRGVSADFFPRSLYVVSGDLGCGHNLFVHLLGLLESPDRGSVFFEDTDTSSLAPSHLDELREKNFGFLFPTHALLPTLTALENIAFPILKCQESTTAEQIDHTHFALQFCQIEGIADFKSADLSFDERTLVSFARAIINRPRVIIAASPPDTPFLSSLARRAVDELGITFIWAASNLSPARKLADHIFTMSNGRLC